jgi:hypothetical protein
MITLIGMNVPAFFLLLFSLQGTSIIVHTSLQFVENVLQKPVDISIYMYRGFMNFVWASTFQVKSN